MMTEVWTGSLTRSQMRQWVDHFHLAPDERRHWNPRLRWVAPVDAELSVEHVSAIMQLLVAKHETLRTGFRRTPRGLPEQIVYDEVPFSYAIEYSATDEFDFRQANNFSNLAFDICNGEPPWRLHLVVRSPDRVLGVVLVAHHILIDGAGVHELAREVDIHLDGKGHSTTQGRRRLSWTARQIAEFEASPAGVEQNEASLRSMSDTLQRTPHHLFPWVSDDPAAHCLSLISASLLDSLRVLAKRHGSTEALVLLTAYCAVLQRLTSYESIPVELLMSNRNSVETGRSIACLFQPLLVLFDVSQDACLGDALDMNTENWCNVADLGGYDFAESKAMEARAGLNRGVTIRPGIVYNYMRTSSPDEDYDTDPALLRLPPGKLLFRMSANMICIDTGEQAIVKLDMKADAMPASTAELVLVAIRRLIVSSAADPKVTIASILDSVGLTRLSPSRNLVLIDGCLVDPRAVDACLRSMPGVIGAKTIVSQAAGLPTLSTEVTCSADIDSPDARRHVRLGMLHNPGLMLPAELSLSRPPGGRVAVAASHPGNQDLSRSTVVERVVKQVNALKVIDGRASYIANGGRPELAPEVCAQICAEGLVPPPVYDLYSLTSIADL